MNKTWEKMQNDPPVPNNEEITAALKIVLEELHQPPHGLHVALEHLDPERKVWTVSISKHTAEISQGEIAGAWQAAGRERDLKRVLQDLLLEKFLWLPCEEI